jgi:uncharacterized protein YdaU (DUF1376 family)
MPSKNQPYLPLYVDDFLADEKLSLCSAESTGVYIRLMCLMHKSDEYGVILLKQIEKQNAKQIKNFASRFAKQMPYDEDTIERSLMELIEWEIIILDGDRLIQKRMVKDEKIRQIRASAGQEGGKKTQSNFAKAKTKANIGIGIDNNISTKDIDSLFETIWSMYPRKEGKGSVSDTQKKKLYGIGLEQMTKAIDRYKQKIESEHIEKKYIKQGSTFFNSGYVDYIDANYTSDTTQQPSAPPKSHIEVINGEEVTIFE